MITGLDELAALTPRWERLVATSPNLTGYATPVAALTWLQWFRAQAHGIHVISVWDDDELVGLAPLSETRIPFTAGTLRILSTPGAEHGYDGEPLLGPEPEPVARMIAEHLATVLRRGTTLVHFRRLVSDGPFAQAIADGSNFAGQRTWHPPRNVLRFDLIEDRDKYLAKLAKKHQVPRRKRRLAERFSKVEYVPHDPELQTALDAMRDMLVRRFGKGEGPEMFSSPGYEAFMRHLLHEMTVAGHARVSSLMADGDRIAVSIDVLVNDHALFYTTAHEQDLAKFSLGNVELFEAISHMHAAGVTAIDLGSAKMAYKDEWTNSTRSHESVTLHTPRLPRIVAEYWCRAALSYRARRIYRHDAWPADESKLDARAVAVNDRDG